jgi:hypothetical protein
VVPGERAGLIGGDEAAHLVVSMQNDTVHLRNDLHQAEDDRLSHQLRFPRRRDPVRTLGNFYMQNKMIMSPEG